MTEVIAKGIRKEVLTNEPALDFILLINTAKNKEQQKSAGTYIAVSFNVRSIACHQLESFHMRM